MQSFSRGVSTPDWQEFYADFAGKEDWVNERKREIRKSTPKGMVFRLHVNAIQVIADSLAISMETIFKQHRFRPM